MSRSLLVGVLVAVLLGGGATSVLGQDSEKAVIAAEEAAQDWLTLLDQDKYEATWKTAAPYFKSSMTADEWTEKVEGIHSNLASLDSRSEISVNVKSEVPNAPDGKYVIFQYETTYDGKKTIETLTVKKDDDTWGVAGYAVNPAPSEN